jgi:hypothetical protein
LKLAPVLRMPVFFSMEACQSAVAPDGREPVDTNRGERGTPCVSEERPSCYLRHCSLQPR